MPLLVGCLALLFPRAILVMVWLFGNGYLQRAYEHWVWPLFGFLLLPLTTLTYAFARNALSATGSISALGWVLIVVAVLVDLGMMGGGRSHYRRHRGIAR